MLNMLNELYISQKYASIYTNWDDTSLFIYGKIIYVNNSHIVIYSISPGGEFDGILTKELCEIIRIEVDGQYSNAMQKIIKEKYLPKIRLKIINDDAISSVLQYAVNTAEIISVELINSGYDDVRGLVKSIDSEMCQILQIDMYGFEDGISIIPVQNISQICVNSLDEQHIMNLYISNKEQSGADTVNSN